MAGDPPVADAALRRRGGGGVAVVMAAPSNVTARMHAAVLHGGGAGEVARVPVPVPGVGEVRVRIEGSGVCGSDLPAWQGRPWFSYPRPAGAPGHEAWGWIEALGPDVEGPAVGTRVAALCFRAYAEFDLADANAVVALPAALEGEPFPGEALACAVNVFRAARVQAGDTVAVLGIGFLGAVVAQLAVKAGARVIAVSRRAFARRLAAQCGAAHTVSLEEPVIQRVAELTNGGLCDVTVEATGRQETLDFAGPLTRVEGRLVIAGFHQDGPRQVDLQLWNWRALELVNAHRRDPAAYVAGMREAVTAAASGCLDLAPLYTHRVPLERYQQALRASVARPDGFMKALVLM